MKQTKLSWWERLLNRLHPPNPHHRICRMCRKPIRRHEHWRQVRVGWFAPVYTVEHCDCKDPLRNDPLKELAKKMTQDLGPGLPFEEPTGAEMPPYGDVYPSYGDVPREKVQ